MQGTQKNGQAPELHLIYNRYISEEEWSYLFTLNDIVTEGIACYIYYKQLENFLTEYKKQDDMSLSVLTCITHTLNSYQSVIIKNWNKLFGSSNEPTNYHNLLNTGDLIKYIRVTDNNGNLIPLINNIQPLIYNCVWIFPRDHSPYPMPENAIILNLESKKIEVVYKEDSKIRKNTLPKHHEKRAYKILKNTTKNTVITDKVLVNKIVSLCVYAENFAPTLKEEIIKLAGVKESEFDDCWKDMKNYRDTYSIHTIHDPQEQHRSGKHPILLIPFKAFQALHTMLVHIRDNFPTTKDGSKTWRQQLANIPTEQKIEVFKKSRMVIADITIE